LQATGIITIAKALQSISSLTDFYINNNQITEEATNDIGGCYTEQYQTNT